MARPSKFDGAREKILQALKIGATRRLACQYAGVSETTFARWQERFVDFVDAINEAEGAAAVGWLAKIEKAANEGSWQAGAWKLERRYPHEYGKQVQEIEQKTEMRVIVEYSDAHTDLTAPALSPADTAD